MKTNKLRTYYLRELDMIEFFNLRNGFPDVIYVPTVMAECDDYAPPEGAVVERVWYDYDRQSVVVCMSHESFPEVCDGCLIQGYSAFVYMQGYKIAQEPVLA